MKEIHEKKIQCKKTVRSEKGKLLLKKNSWYMVSLVPCPIFGGGHGCAFFTQVLDFKGKLITMIHEKRTRAWLGYTQKELTGMYRVYK